MLMLIRHGEAGWDASSDEVRCLTESGIRFVRQQSTRYAAQLAGVERVLCSPFVRTRQTAELLMPHCPQAECVFDLRLTPDASVADALAALEEHWSEQLLVVTHQPLIGYLVNYLEEGSTHSPEPLMPGQAVVLELAWPAPAQAMRLTV